MLLALVCVAMSAAFVVLSLARPSDGARLEPGEETFRSQGVVVTALREEPDGLRADDFVVAVVSETMEPAHVSLRLRPKEARR